MLIAIIGENCTGKSTLAAEIAKRIPANIITGKDYLRLAKSEFEAKKLFTKQLAEAVSGENIIYVIAQPDQLALLPEGAVRILAKAQLSDIKERFKARMHGVLPPPVERMLEQHHGIFDSGSYDAVFDSSSADPTAFCDALTIC